MFIFGLHQVNFAWFTALNNCLSECGPLCSPHSSSSERGSFSFPPSPPSFPRPLPFKPTFFSWDAPHKQSCAPYKSIYWIFSYEKNTSEKTAVWNLSVWAYKDHRHHLKLWSCLKWASTIVRVCIWQENMKYDDRLGRIQILYVMSPRFDFKNGTNPQIWVWSGASLMVLCNQSEAI